MFHCIVGLRSIIPCSTEGNVAGTALAPGDPDDGTIIGQKGIPKQALCWLRCQPLCDIYAERRVTVRQHNTGHLRSSRTRRQRGCKWRTRWLHVQLWCVLWLYQETHFRCSNVKKKIFWTMHSIYSTHIPESSFFFFFFKSNWHYSVWVGGMCLWANSHIEVILKSR